MFREITKLKLITEEVSQLLKDGDMDGTLEKLKQREIIINTLTENSTKYSMIIAASGSQKNINIENMTSIANSIKKLDNENKELLKIKLDDTYKAINDLLKEKQSVKNLKSISKMDQKQRVDILNY